MVEMNVQGFRIYNERAGKCYGVAQFMYRGWEVSMSEYGFTFVAVFKQNEHCGDFDTVEKAIEFINKA